MRWLFAVVIGGFLLCAAQAETLAPKVFTETFAKRLQAARQGSTVTVKGDLAIQIKDADGRTLEMSLANFYAGYRGDPNSLEELSRKYLAGVPPPGGASTKRDELLDRTRIVPVIKDRPWLDEVNGRVRATGKDAPELAVDDFNNELVIIYALDDSNRMRFLTADELAGIKRNELKALAVENLIRIAPKIEVRSDGNVSMMTAGGDYAASLLLLDDIWTGGQVKVNGDIVAAIPARDVVLVTGSQNRTGLKQMREAVAKLAVGPYRLTTALFVYRKGRFVKFGRD
jgi:uncharacterized protein YtpQ (UPF0354 family)